MQSEANGSVLLTGEIERNRGPSPEGEGSRRWHRCVSVRERLLPKLPVKTVRLQVKYARGLEFDHKTLAGVRAATGHLSAQRYFG